MRLTAAAAAAASSSSAKKKVSANIKGWKQEKFRTSLPSTDRLVAFFMAFCVLFVAITSFAPEPVGLLSTNCPCEDGIQQCICPRPTVEALTVFQMVCLANSRVAAYACYPLYPVLCLTMSRNLLAWLQHTVIVEYVPFPTCAHHLHKWAGTCVGILVLWHGLWHLIRWGVQNNMQFLVDHPTGITGLIMIVLTPVIVCPMRIEYLRKRISFEIRKFLHYTSWIWMGALCFHAPKRNVFWIVGTPLVIYWVDWLFGLLINTRMAPSARFVRLESAVMIRLKKPKGFELKGAGGYCYLCVPWITKLEWHAFSAFKDPHNDDYVCFCIAKAGGWTRKLHEEVHEPIDRRIWLNGPYPSPFETALDTDNIISVASGIGITPALSAIKSLADHRKMHLIWMVRDASLLEFMFDFGIVVDDDAYTLIFYTGKRELVFQRPLPYNVWVFKGRPDLDDLVVSIITATKSGQELDMSDYEEIIEHHVDHDLEGATPAPLNLEHEFFKEVTRLTSTYSIDELFRAAVNRSHLGTRFISYEGLKGLIEDIFVRKFSDDQLRELFEQADQNKSGTISRGEFDSFMQHLQQRNKEHFDQIRKTRQQQKYASSKVSISFGPTVEEEEADKVVQVERPDHWRLLYCGGSAPVVEALNKVSAEHCIPFSIESFGW
ncbi:FAD binding protein [Nitzschia inconspicua]|nr:FAD binding protein [Nitzschia inconspicua]